MIKPGIHQRLLSGVGLDLVWGGNMVLSRKIIKHFTDKNSLKLYEEVNKSLIEFVVLYIAR